MSTAPLQLPGLIVLLPASAGELWHWWRVTGSSVSSVQIFDPDREAPPWGEIGEVTALVPAGPAPVSDRPMPDMPLAQALAATRLSLTQGGLADVRHVAVAAAQGRLLSCSVSLDRMDHWLAALAAQGIDPRSVVPAALVLPSRTGTMVLADIGMQLLARTEQAAFAAEPGLAEAIGEGLAQARLSDDEVAGRLAAVHALPPLDLRQGQYAQRRVSVFAVANWISLARMTATAALLALALMLVWIVKWNLDSSAHESRALELAQARFPSATDLDSAERLLAAELGRRGQGGASFAAPAAALLDAVRPVAGVRLRDLGYSPDGTLRFTAAAPRAEDVNAVLIALQNQGWKVTVPPSLAPDPTGATVAAITLRAP